jgi:hypothetical protein
MERKEAAHQKRRLLQAALPYYRVWQDIQFRGSVGNGHDLEREVQIR